VFPLQVVVNLNDPGVDHTGGEFLLVEQRPRAQSRGTAVLIPQGRTHAGEPAWDSVCVNLTAAAYDDTHPPPPITSLRELALASAAKPSTPSSRAG